MSFFPKEIRDSQFALWAIMAAVMTFSANSARAAGPPDGAQLYKTRCSVCHGADGAGSTSIGKVQKLPDLRSPEVQQQSDAKLIETVTRGTKKMQGYENRMTAEQIRQVVAYMRQLSKHPPAHRSAP